MYLEQKDLWSTADTRPHSCISVATCCQNVLQASVLMTVKCLCFEHIFTFSRKNLNFLFPLPLRYIYPDIEWSHVSLPIPSRDVKQAAYATKF